MAKWDAKEFQRRLAAAGDDVRGAAAVAATQFAEHVLGAARELTPVSATNPHVMEEYVTRTGATRRRAAKDAKGDKKKNPYYTGTSGALRDSGTVRPAEVHGDRITAEVGFHTDYAAAVHENLNANHRYPGAVNPRAQAKYLETALRDNATKFVPFVGRALHRAGGGA